MGSRTLQDLPPEIHLMVLRKISRPKDLISLTSVSSLYWRVFSKNKAIVVKSIVDLAIPPANMPLAMAACLTPTIRSSKGPSPLPPGINAGSWNEDEIADGLLQIEEECSALGSVPADAQYHYRLLRLAMLTDTFVDEFARATLGQLRSGIASTSIPQPEAGDPVSTATSCQFSDVERCRLQRAVLRFEFIRKTYMMAYVTFKWESPDMTRVFKSIFIDELPGWEKEALTSIYLFLRGRVDKALDEVEDLFVTAALTTITDEERLTLSEREPHLRSNSDWNFLDQLDYHCLRFFEDSAKFQQNAQADFMVALGLPFLEHLRSASAVEQACIVKSYGSIRSFFEFGELFRTPFVPPPELLDTLHDEDCKTKVAQSYNPEPEVNKQAHIDCVDRPNSAWLWITSLQKPDPDVDDSNPSGAMGLARLGLMFWDVARLEAAGLFEVDSTKLEGPTMDGLRDRGEEPSVVERLKGQWVSAETMRVVAPTLFARFEEEATLRRVEY